VIRTVTFSADAQGYTARPSLVVLDVRALLVAGTALWALLFMLRVALALGPFVSVPVLALPVLVVVLYMQHSLRAVRRNNPAVGALRRGDTDLAKHELAAGLGRYSTPATGYVLVSNLGNVALRRGEFAAATALYEAGQRCLGSWAGLLGPRHRAQVGCEQALALCGAGRVDEAARVLAAVPDGTGAATIAAVARALVEYQQGRPEAAIERLDGARASLRNTLTGFWSALSDALSVLAMQRLGGIYRGQPRQATPLHYGDATRAIVDRILPGAAAVLS
jgi:hypothetical protein